MKFILDSSVAIKWTLPEVHSDKADTLRDDFLNAIHEVLAPDVFPIEVAHALTRAERQARIPVGKAQDLLADILTTAPQLHSYQLLLSRAVEIASKMRIGVYDCLYVAQAEQEQCEFVTADDRLENNVQKQFPFVIHLSTMP